MEIRGARRRAPRMRAGRRAGGGLAPWLVAAAVAVAAACSGKSQVPDGGGEIGGSGPTGSTTSASTSTGTSTSSGATTTSTGSGGAGGATGTGGAGGGEPCLNLGPGEPNDTEIEAAELGTLTDCDESGAKTEAVLSGKEDVDWYRYAATDTFGCEVDPSRAFVVAEQGAARICAFADCAEGDADVTCPAGTTQDASPSGRPGCCGSGDFTMDVDCAGVDDDATIFIRVDQPSGDCVTYELGYHY